MNKGTIEYASYYALTNNVMNKGLTFHTVGGEEANVSGLQGVFMSKLWRTSLRL